MLYIGSTLQLGAWSWLQCLLNKRGIHTLIRGTRDYAVDSAEGFLEGSIPVLVLTAQEIFNSPGSWRVPSSIVSPYIVLDPSLTASQVRSVREGSKRCLPFSSERSQGRDLKRLMNQVVTDLLSVVNVDDLNPAVPREGVVCLTLDLEVSSAAEASAACELLDWAEDLRLALTVFLTGMTAQIASSNRRLREALGRHKLGNHTSDHGTPCEENITANAALLSELFGVKPVVFRAPYLEISSSAYSVLVRHQYIADSSLFGVQPFPIVVEGKVLPLVELPLLDGGDYALFHQRRWSVQQYSEYLRQRLRTLVEYGPAFALLFHLQYSGIKHWEAAIRVLKDVSYDLRTINDQSRLYSRVTLGH